MTTQNAQGREAALRALTAEVVEGRLRAGMLFTTLDISNDLKRQRFGVRHGEIADAVRELYTSGGLQAFGYDRCLIEVNTENGEKITQAFLYLPDNTTPDAYGRRIQDALPPVPDDEARDLPAYVPSRGRVLLAAWANKGKGGHRAHGTRGKIRRDGALPIPRRLVAEAGWQVGDTLTLQNEGADGVALTRATDDTVAILVRVWSDLRVRVAKSKLHRAAPGGWDLSTQTAIAWENDALHIRPEATGQG